MPRRTTSLSWFGLALWLAAASTALGQAPNWRFFKRDADGLSGSAPTSLHFSVAGNLWISHEDGRTITRFDGYRFTAVNPPAGFPFRVYESATGQLWTLDANGLQFHAGTGWTAHPVAEIAVEIQSKPVRLVRQIPLHPAERQNVLVLLNEQLLKYDALSRTKTLIKRSANAGIGAFAELVSTPGGDLWITGESGAALITGGARDLLPTTPWKVFPLAGNLNVRGLRSPLPDDHGGLRALADQLPGNRRVMARLANGQWTLEPVPVDGLRQGWRTPDGRMWGLDVNSLHQWQTADGEARTMDDLGLVPGNLSDVAVEPGGAFWLSTPEGIARYAPAAWRAPAEAPATTEAITAIHETPEGALYFLGQTELLSFNGDQWDRHSLPDGSGAQRGLGSLPDGRIFHTDARGLTAFDPATRTFERHDAPGGEVHYLGNTPAGPLFRSWHTDGGQALLGFSGGRFATPAIGSPPDDFGAWQTLIVGSSNTVWIGGELGLAEWREGEWLTHPHTPNQLTTPVTVLAELSPGVLWAAGANRIWIWDGRLLNDFLTDTDPVHQMAATRDGTYWIASEAGLQRRFEQVWVALGPEEAIPTGVLAFHEDAAGRLWIGHRRGLARFYPAVDDDPPQTIIGEVPAGLHINETVFTVSFTGRDRWNATPPGRMLFSYRIDGGEWSTFATANRVTLAASAHKAGDRLFEVRAMDRFLNIDPRPALWQFTIVVPWFKDPRLMGMTLLAAIAVLVFAGLAVNRHVRLRRSYAEVERIVRERTQQLERANRELAHAEKMRSLGTLAAGVAHDFNSILSIIRGSAQIIEANPGNPDKIQTRISRIKSMVEQGSTLVKAMLGFSRADDAALLLDDVATVVRDTVPLLGDRLPAEVEVTVQVADGLPVVHGSRELLQQILLNLVLNAIDAMEAKGRLQLTCQLLHQLPAQQILPAVAATEYVGVSVEDSGSGITPENLSRIFEPFFTTKAFSTRHGTGLGLSMVYEFCKELGYGLSVRSELQRGTSFIIIIPAFDPAAARPAQRPATT